MIANVNKNTGKLLVAILAMFMIVAGAAVVMSDDTQAATDLDSEVAAGGTVELDDDATISSQTISKDVTINGNGNTITVSGKITLTAKLTINNATIALDTGYNARQMFATGNNAGALVLNDVTFPESETAGVAIYNDKGTVTVENSDLNGWTIAQAISTGNAPVTSLSNVNNANMDVAGTVEIGDNLNLSGTTLGKLTLYTDASITVPRGETLTAESISPANGASNVIIEVLGSLNGEVAESITVTSTPDASINGSAGGTWEPVSLAGSLASPVNGTANQRIIITDDLVVKAGQYITVLGELVVEEGAVLTIEDGAYIEASGNANVIINGDVVIEDSTTASGKTYAFSFSGTGTLTIAGSMTLNAAKAFNSTGTTVIEGTFTISEEAGATFADTTVAENGNVEIYGQANGSITNNGAITINTYNLGTTSSNPLSIQMGIDGTVEILNMIGWLEVSDSALTFMYQNTPKDMVNDNTLKIDDVRGVSISESVTYSNDAEKGRIGTNVMVVSGTMIPGNDGTADAKEAIFGIVPGSYVTLGENTTFDGIEVNVNGNLDVPVDVMANTENTSIIGSGAITVTGSITTNVPISTTTVNAAMYRTETSTTNPTSYYVYTTLENAIASGMTPITVTGKITVEESIQIPVGTTVNASGATIVIDEAATVDVLAQDRSSGIINGGTIEVDGTLTFQNNERGNKVPTIISDTSSAADPAKTYTNIYNALENAAEGETVTVTKTNENVLIDKDVEVKDGVTLSVPSGTGITVDYGATVTVNGTANIVGKYKMNTEDAEKTDGKTVVNGMFLYSNNTDYTGQIAGAYFMYNGVSAISTVENAASIVNEIQSNNITVYGENTVADVAFDYSGDYMTLVINADATLNAGTIDMGAVGFKADGCFTGTLEFTNGSVVLSEVTGISASDIVSYDGDNQVYTATVSGDTVAYGGDATDGKGAVSFIGAVSSGATYTTADVTVPADATLTVTGGTIADITVEGTVEVAGSPTFTTAVVMGTLNVAQGKTVNVGTLYAGVAVDDNGAVSDSAAAVISEGVSVTGTAYVGPDADVNEKVLSGINKITEYYVEDAVYITAYDKSKNGIAINGITVNTSVAKFEQWNDADGNKVGDTVKVGAAGYDKVYAQLNYNICEVEVLDIPGVSVYIDGKEFNQSNFPGGMVSVGEHTIDVYVTPGWTGEPVITVNGQTVTDGKFTASADQTTTIQITGVTAGQATTSGGDDGLGLTDILLIILVVLIVIMAIMVAMRLMRS